MKRARGGLFVALEGIDGSGTSTQTRALARGLRERFGVRVHETCEPSHGPIGRMIRGGLGAESAAFDAATLALLFAADRLDHYRREILPVLAEGGVVISDRYVLSSVVYQSLDCPLPWVLEINARAPWPDLCVLVAIPAEVGLRRVEERRAADGGPVERYDAADLQRRLAAGYHQAAEGQLPGQLPGQLLGAITTIDGTQPIDGVTQALLELCGAALIPRLDPDRAHEPGCADGRPLATIPGT